MNLLDHLRSYGLTVHPEAGWETNTNSGRDRSQTVGIINHWDAISSVPSTNAVYMYANRFEGILYHIVIFPDGHCALLSQRYVWHAGNGDSKVLEALEKKQLPPAPRDGVEDKSGNPHTIGVCLNYWPDGDALPAAQYSSLVKVNRALVDWYGLSTNQIIDHAGWKTSKSDISGRVHPAPKGFSMAKLREDVQAWEDEEVATMTMPDWFDRTDIDKLEAAGAISKTGADNLRKSGTKETYDYWRTLTIAANLIDIVNKNGVDPTLFAAHVSDGLAHVHRHSGGRTGEPVV